MMGQHVLNLKDESREFYKNFKKIVKTLEEMH